MACGLRTKRTVLAFAYGRAVRCGTALPMGGDRPHTWWDGCPTVGQLGLSQGGLGQPGQPAVSVSCRFMVPPSDSH